MIKILNQKNIKDINNMKKEGTYGSPFFGERNPSDGPLIDTEAIHERIDTIEFTNAELGVAIYEELSRIEESNTEAILSLYEQVLGGM